MPKQKRVKTKYPGVYYIEPVSIDKTTRTERIYYILYRKDSVQVEEKVGRQYKDNMTPAKASKIRARRLDGDEPTNRERREEAKVKAITGSFNDLYDRFIENKQHLKSLKDDIGRYKNHLKRFVGKKQVSEITIEDVDRIRGAIQNTHQPATVKQVLVLLKRIVNFGASRSFCQPLPFNIEMPKLNNLKTEYLTNEQIDRLIKAADEDRDRNTANMMKIALANGMRKGELCELKWDDIDFERSMITIRDPKGGIDQRIPLNESVRAFLSSHLRTSSPYVFPSKGCKRLSVNRRAVNRIKKRAELPDDFRPFHGLRHTFASTLASSGLVDMYVLQKLMTHKSPLMTQRYAHLRDEALQKASGVMDSFIRATE